jgi:hypothetical protein
MTIHQFTSPSLLGLSIDAGSMDLSVVEDLATVPDLPWLEKALCGQLPLEQLDRFFVDAGRTIDAETIALCRRCPVRLDCLEHAYRNDITSGFFGGMSPSKRRTLSHDEALEEVRGERRA